MLGHKEENSKVRDLTMLRSMKIFIFTAILGILLWCGGARPSSAYDPGAPGQIYVLFIEGFNTSPNPVPAGQAVNVYYKWGFYNDGTDSGYIDFGDGSREYVGPWLRNTSSNPGSYTGRSGVVPHTYAQPGVYTITLHASTNGFVESVNTHDQTITQYVGSSKAFKREKTPKKGPCDPDTFTGNASDTTVDPVPTRGFPLGYEITVNTQAVDFNRPMGNAAFTYDMHVGTQTKYDDNGNPSTHWLVVGGDGRRLDFGVTTANPVAEAGVFSTLTAVTSGGSIVGYTLTHASTPDDIASAGNYSYTFDASGKLTDIYDPQNNRQHLSYTGGYLTSITDIPTGKNISFGYTGSLITSITQNGGAEITSLTYDSGLLTKIDSGSLTSKEYSYLPGGLLESIMKDNDRTTLKTFSYMTLPDKDGVNTVPMANVSSSVHNSNVAWGQDTNLLDGKETVYQKNAKGGVTAYEYDAQGNLLSETHPAFTGATQPYVANYTYNTGKLVTASSDNSTSAAFDYTLNGILKLSTDALSHSWAWSYYGADFIGSQNPVQSTASTSEGVYYTDANQPHVPTSYVDANSNGWSFGHNSYGQLTSVTPPSGSAFGSSSITYDETSGSTSLGYPKMLMDGNGDLMTYNSYDSLGDLLSVSTYPYHGDTSQPNTSIYQYDALQRLNQVTRPDGRTYQYQYFYNDYYGYSTYDSNLNGVVDEAGTQYQFGYCGPCGALTGIYGPLGWSLGLNYDGDGSLLAFTDAKGHATQYNYGYAGELTQVTYPDNSTLSYLYNNGGNVRQITNGSGHQVNYGYDAAGRLHQITYPTSGQAGVTINYNSDDTYSDVTDGVGNTSYNYYTNGWLQSIKYDYRTSGLSNIQELDYTYYSDGMRKTLTWKNGASLVGTWNYGYDSAGRLASVTNPWTEITHWSYDGEGKLRLQNNSNGTRTKYCYNEATNWPTQITHSRGAIMLASYGLQYDNGSNTVGNLTRVYESDGSQANYGYDELYRLTSETRTGTAPVSHTYEYDLAGNRKTYDGLAATFDAANKQNGQTYDGDGNVTNSGTLAWDDNERLVAKTGVAYQYDAFDFRVSKAVGAVKTFFIFDGNLPLGEVQSNNTVNVAYTWGGAGLVTERFIPSNTSLWYHFDAQANTRLLTTEAGSLADTYTYSAYGQQIGGTGSDVNAFRYGGQAGNYSDGYVFCGERWYDPNVGHWLSRDPSDYAGGANLYSYCGDNPVKYLDQSGLNEIPCWEIAEGIRRQVSHYDSDLQAMRDDVNDLYGQVDKGKDIYRADGSKIGSWDSHIGDAKEILQSILNYWDLYNKKNRKDPCPKFGENYKVLRNQVVRARSTKIPDMPDRYKKMLDNLGKIHDDPIYDDGIWLPWIFPLGRGIKMGGLLGGAAVDGLGGAAAGLGRAILPKVVPALKPGWTY